MPILINGICNSVLFFASAGCVSLTGDFYKLHSKTFSNKLLILITVVAVIPFISQSVES
jgi:hypothetical protein